MKTHAKSEDVRRLAAVARCLADHLHGPDLPCHGVVDDRTCISRLRESRRNPNDHLGQLCDFCLAYHLACQCANALEGRAALLARAEARAALPAPAPPG